MHRRELLLSNNHTKRTATTMIAKIRNIKLKHTILVAFLLLSLLSHFKNIATEQSNDENNIIKNVTKKILGKSGYLLGIRGNIIDWICTSVYNHYTEHNSRKAGWYHGKFYIYGGIKIKITKKVYLDVYYSLLKLIPSLFFDGFIYNCQYLPLLIPVSFLTFSINIRINKKFYLAISPIHYILWKCIELGIYACYAHFSI